LDHYLSNADIPQFDYESFLSAYNSDPRLKNLIVNFNKQQINLKQSSADELGGSSTDKNTVNQMARRATDVGRKL
jgi:hypothetical protein